MMYSTGRHGYLCARTDYGFYRIPELWADRQMTLVDDLALFLEGSGDSFTGDLLRLMRKADPGNRSALRAAFPKIDAALFHWERLSPLVNVAGGPTMRQLLTALNDDDEPDYMPPRLHAVDELAEWTEPRPEPLLSAVNDELAKLGADPITEEELTTRPRCSLCGRLEGMPTAPCGDCPDAGSWTPSSPSGDYPERSST